MAPADPHERATIAQAIALRLREMREARGWSQTDVADRLGVDRPLVARTETGRHLITLDVLARYAAVHGCSIAAIVSAADVALNHVSSPREERHGGVSREEEA